MDGNRPADSLARELLDLRRKIADAAGYRAQVRDEESAADFYTRAVFESATRTQREPAPTDETPQSKLPRTDATPGAARSRPLLRMAALIGFVLAAGSGIWLGASAIGEPASVRMETEGSASDLPTGPQSMSAELEALERQIDSAADREVTNLVARRDSLRALIGEPEEGATGSSN